MEKLCLCPTGYKNPRGEQIHNCGWHGYSRLRDARASSLRGDALRDLVIVRARMEGIYTRGRDATYYSEDMPKAKKEPIVLVGKWLTLEKEVK